jgi:hypothetical protein
VSSDSIAHEPSRADFYSQVAEYVLPAELGDVGHGRPLISSVSMLAEARLTAAAGEGDVSDVARVVDAQHQ